MAKGRLVAAIVQIGIPATISVRDARVGRRMTIVTGQRSAVTGTRRRAGITIATVLVLAALRWNAQIGLSRVLCNEVGGAPTGRTRHALGVAEALVNVTLTAETPIVPCPAVGLAVRIGRARDACDRSVGAELSHRTHKGLRSAAGSRRSPIGTFRRAARVWRRCWSRLTARQSGGHENRRHQQVRSHCWAQSASFRPDVRAPKADRRRQPPLASVTGPGAPSVIHRFTIAITQAGSGSEAKNSPFGICTP